MKISDIKVHTLVGQGSQGAYGAPCAALIRVQTDEGLTGWGETDSHPTMVRAVVEAEFHDDMMSGLAPILIGEDVDDPMRLWEKMYRAVTNIGRDGLTLTAMAGIDIALWDLKARSQGLPLVELLGGTNGTRLPYYATYPLGQSLAETRATAVSAAQSVSAAKFGWVPFGQGTMDDDESIVKTLRDGLGEERKLLIDGGLAFDVASAVERSHMLSDYDVYWFEEPLAAYDIGGYRELRKRSPVPIAAGELSSSAAELERLIEAQCVDVLQIDLTRVGISQGLEVARKAAACGIRVVNHTYTQDINLAASLHFIAAVDSSDLVEVQHTRNEIRDVLCSPRPTMDTLTVGVPNGIGLGVVPDETMIARFDTSDPDSNVQ